MDINILLWQPVKWAVHPEWFLCGAGAGGGGGKGAGSAGSTSTGLQNTFLCPVRGHTEPTGGPVIYMECNRSMYS